MADFPTAKTNAVDNVTDVLAKHINNLENKVGIDSSTDTSSLDYKVNALESALPSGAIVGTTDTQELSSKTLTSPILKGSIGGWISIPVTCVYASADDPTYTMYVAGNATTYLWAGMRFKCTQTTDRMFIITAVGTYDSGNNRTPITLYGGTDFDLANATISNPYYSPVKCPYGFPMSPAKWSVSGNMDSSGTVTARSYSTTATISVPIGSWRLYGEAQVTASNYSGTTYDWHCGFTTTAGSYTGFDTSLRRGSYQTNTSGVNFSGNRSCFTWSGQKLELTSKTNVYFQVATYEPNANYTVTTAFSNYNLICAYL